MTRIAFPMAVCCWITLWVYWFVSARNRKAVKQRESGAERMRQILPMAACCVLLFEPFLGFGWLGWRFVAKRPDVEFAGLLLTVLGVAFAIWARAHLGENWSAAVSIRTSHELIRTGPYRRIRHPIYTGMLLATAGTAIVVGQMRGLLAFAICFTAFFLKATKEERWLAREFGEAFQTHARHTGMFLPRFS